MTSLGMIPSGSIYGTANYMVNFFLISKLISPHLTNSYVKQDRFTEAILDLLATCVCLSISSLLSSVIKYLPRCKKPRNKLLWYRRGVEGTHSLITTTHFFSPLQTVIPSIWKFRFPTSVKQRKLLPHWSLLLITTTFPFSLPRHHFHFHPSLNLTYPLTEKLNSGLIKINFMETMSTML